MNLHERATLVAKEILDEGLLSTCGLQQTNPHRTARLNLVDPELRDALESALRPARPDGLGDSQILRTAVLVDKLRELVNFGLFRDLRNPPSPLDISPERRTQFRLIEARATALLELADQLLGPDARTPLEKIQSHVEQAREILSEEIQFARKSDDLPMLSRLSAANAALSEAIDAIPPADEPRGPTP